MKRKEDNSLLEYLKLLNIRPSNISRKLNTSPEAFIRRSQKGRYNKKQIECIKKMAYNMQPLSKEKKGPQQYGIQKVRK